MFTYFALDGQTALYWDYNCVNPVFTTAGAGFSSSQQTYDTQASVSYPTRRSRKAPAVGLCMEVLPTINTRNAVALIYSCTHYDSAATPQFHCCKAPGRQQLYEAS